MTEEEVEVVAEELAKIGGVSWYPGREKGTLMRVVCDRYRDRARAAIAALDRHRESMQGKIAQDNARKERELQNVAVPAIQASDLKPGATVIYRPPGDRRSYPCRVIEIEGSRAYLTPILRACTDWVSIEHLMPASSETDPTLLQK